MSVFTGKELEYLAEQRLGRIATVGPDGQPHVVPTSFRYNAEHDAIDVGGMRMSRTKKLRDVQHTGRASIVVDDVLPPWQPRMIEVRGTAAVIPSGGKAFGERFEDTIVRMQPELADELGRDGQHLVGVQPVEPGVQNAREAAGGRRLQGRVEEQVNRRVRFYLGRQEERGLAFRHRLEQIVPLGVVRRERRQLLGELQQQLQPVLGHDGVEVVGYLLQPGIQGGSGHGLSPRVMGTRTLFPHSVHDPS